jgi:molybdopterin-guanine dinucleotide biosynthesis protein A
MVTGLILAGGKSSRFLQGDKALFWDKQFSKTWVEKTYETLSALTDRVFISVNAKNMDKIAALLPSAALLTDEAPYIACGPLSALYAARAYADDLLLLPVDNPEITSASIHQLFAHQNCYARNTFTIAHVHFQPQQLENYLSAGNRRVRDFFCLISAVPIDLTADELVDHNES